MPWKYIGTYKHKTFWQEKTESTSTIINLLLMVGDSIWVFIKYWFYKLDYPTQWSDGVPYVTQCPISPKVNYTWYTFNAIPAGTHWYHSHSEFQRDDGVFGALIVKERTNQINDMPKPIKNILEDICDFEEHYMIITDWYQDTAALRFNTNPTTPPRQCI